MTAKIYTLNALDPASTGGDDPHLRWLPIVRDDEITYDGKPFRIDHALRNTIKASFEGKKTKTKIILGRDHKEDRVPRDSTSYGEMERAENFGDELRGLFRMNDEGLRLISGPAPAYCHTSATIDAAGELVGLTLTNRPALVNMSPIQALLDSGESNPARALVQLASRTGVDEETVRRQHGADPITDAERQAAARAGQALRDGSYPVRTRAELKAAIVLANSKHGQWQAARRLIARRASELHADDLIPDWAADAGDGDDDGKDSRPTALDDSPAALLDDPSRRHELDAVVRTLMRERDCTYLDALDSYRAAVQEARVAPTGRPLTHGRILSACRVKALDEFEQDVRVLERRDGAVRHMLDAATAEVIDRQRLDPQGRVLLDESRGDVAHLLYDEEESERRWRKAKSLDRNYEQRSRWQADDRLHLEATPPVDLLASLSRPVELAEARQEAAHTAHMLDLAIATGRTPRERANALDRALEASGAARDGVTPPSPELHLLDQSARDNEYAKRIGELGVCALDRCMALYLHDGHSLESAFELARAEFPPKTLRHEAPADPDARAELHAAIMELARAEGTSYLVALEKFAGV